MVKSESIHGFTEDDRTFLNACARCCRDCYHLCWCDVHKFYCRLGLPLTNFPCRVFVSRSVDKRFKRS
jgi:hypothetical protein